jgi:hypothetical protein
MQIKSSHVQFDQVLKWPGMILGRLFGCHHRQRPLPLFLQTSTVQEVSCVNFASSFSFSGKYSIAQFFRRDNSLVKTNSR